MHWLGDEIAVAGLYDLNFDAPVGAVLNVCECKPYETPARLDYLHQGFPDAQPFPLEKVRECVLWVDGRIASGKRVLVHCAEGNSRSVTVAVCWYLHKGHALDAIKRRVLFRKPFAQLQGRPTSQPQYFQDAFLQRFLRLLAERPRG